MKKKSIVKELRKELSIQQKDLAQRLEITRQTLTKYESEPEAIPIPIIKKMAVILGVDYRTIIDNKRYDLDPVISADGVNQDNECIATDLVEKFYQIFMYLLTQLGCYAQMGRTNICSVLYFMEYDYFKETGKDLLGIKFVKTENGAEPISFDGIVESMEKKNLIESFISKTFNHGTTKYMPCINPKLTSLTANELNFINKEISIYSSFETEDFEIAYKSNKPYAETPYDENDKLKEIITIA